MRWQARSYKAIPQGSAQEGSLAWIGAGQVRPRAFVERQQTACLWRPLAIGALRTQPTHFRKRPNRHQALHYPPAKTAFAM